MGLRPATGQLVWEPRHIATARFITQAQMGMVLEKASCRAWPIRVQADAPLSHTAAREDNTTHRSHLSLLGCIDDDDARIRRRHVNDMQIETCGAEGPIIVVPIRRLEVACACWVLGIPAISFFESAARSRPQPQSEHL